MSVAIEKSKLRKIFKQKRSSFSREEVVKKSQQINQNFIKSLLPKIYQKNSDKIFSLYLPSGNEVTTELIAEHFRKNKIKFSYPKILKQNHPLEFFLSDEDQQFVPNKFFPKILEPISGQKILPDFVILPLLAFDSDLSRLGMGGGFFDRTIQNLKMHKSEIITISLAYDVQRLHENLPIEKTDQRLDFIVTEKNIFLAS